MLAAAAGHKAASAAATAVSASDSEKRRRRGQRKQRSKQHEHPVSNSDESGERIWDLFYFGTFSLSRSLFIPIDIDD